MHSYTVEDEKISQSSEFSPCVVQSDESLLRLGYHPEHINEGKIVPTAIATQDLKERGFSVDREKYHSKELIQNRAVAQSEKRPETRQEAYISIFSCSSVRNIYINDHERAFIVLDIATKENPAHASIYGNTKTKSILRKIRVELSELLNRKLISLDEFLSYQ